MVVEAPQARSVDERQQLLNLIPGREIGYLLKRPGIKKDLIKGWIGERGGGKSGSAAVDSLIDYMFDGIPCFSNMAIACDIEIPDSWARKYGLARGGVAVYRAKPIDMPALLRFDEMYRGSHILLDEINVEIADARRAMSNTNLFANRLAQEIRHLEASISFTCISEMAVDPRWRDIVDAYVKCEDTAYFAENIAAHKPAGVDFAWAIYLMNKCFRGDTYQMTGKAITGTVFHFKPWRGVYDDKEFQGRGMTKYGIDIKKYDGTEMSLDNVSIGDAPNVVAHREKWGWFEPIAIKLLEELGQEDYVIASAITDHPEVKRRRLAKDTISKYLQETYQIESVYKSVGGKKRTYYTLAYD